jgi:hypothetical protein
MVYDYLITLKKSDFRVVDQVSQLMYLFALLAFGYFYYNYPKSGKIYLLVLVLIVICWVYTINKKRKHGKAFFRLGLIFAAAGWIAGPERNIWMAVLYAIAGLIEKQVKFPNEIGFSEKEISINSLPKTTLSWNELNNVVIKEGLLTIDRKNNKLFQKEIEGDVSPDIEKDFNNFCQLQLSSVKNDG